MKWEADAYDRLSDPQFTWALEVLDWRAWQGDETVLDAGCGTGRVTEALLARLPRGRVVAVDRDPGMVAKARARLGPRAQVLEADVAALPDLDPVDVVLSTAVLHWVPDHDAAFRGFFRALRPGGEALLQFGGAGNIAAVKGAAARIASRPPFASHFAGWSAPWHFETAEATAARLRAAGFPEVEASLEPKRPTFPGRAEWTAFCASAPLRPHLSRLPAALGPPFLEAVASLWESEGRPWALDYVRLNARASKAKV